MDVATTTMLATWDAVTTEAFHWLKKCGLLPMKTKRKIKAIISMPFDQDVCDTCRAIVDGATESQDAYHRHSGVRLEVGNVLYVWGHLCARLPPI